MLPDRHDAQVAALIWVPLPPSDKPRSRLANRWRAPHARRLKTMRHHRSVLSSATKSSATKKRRPRRKRRGLPPGPRKPDRVGRFHAVRLALWGAFALACLLAVVLGVIFVLRDEVRLDLHHEQAVGRVVDVYRHRGGPDSVRVEFSAGGRPAGATVELPWFAMPPQDGAQVRIEYLKSDPSVARRAGAHDAVEFAEVFGIIALIAVGCAILATHPPRLPSRRRRPQRT